MVTPDIPEDFVEQLALISRFLIKQIGIIRHIGCALNDPYELCASPPSTQHRCDMAILSLTDAEITVRHRLNPISKPILT